MYVPTNHVYVGDIFLLGKADIIKTDLSVREGLGGRARCKCVLSGWKGGQQLTRDGRRDRGVRGHGPPAHAQGPAEPL